MTSSAAVPPDLMGDQEPRHSWVPPYVSSTGKEAIELAHLAGLDLDPWQQWCLTNSLGEREDGKWAAFGVGLVVSRQNGKGGLLEARELAGLFLLHERLIIHSAHQFDTSQEAFERLWSLIEGSSELSSRLAKNQPTRSHGAEGIKLKDGCRIRFRTRTKGGGRGFTADCLILDEAMILPDAFLAAVLPTLSARPNPQVWYTGSAVDQSIHEHGLVLARVRDRGLKGGDDALMYAEWSAVDGLDEVTHELAVDPQAWARANPALGIRISPEYVAHERREFYTNLRGFAVERLGVGDWPDTSEDAGNIIDPKLWVELGDRDSTFIDRPVLAFDVSPTRTGCIAAAGKRGDGNLHIEIIEHKTGTGWMVDRILELNKRHRPVEVICDAGGPAGSLVPELEKHSRDLRLTLYGAKEHAQACGVFLDAVKDGTLRHTDDPHLNNAVNGASTRSMGEAWAWSRKTSAVDISPLVAVTLAHLGAKTMRQGIGVASFSAYAASMSPEALEEKRKKADDRIKEILARRR